MLHLKVLSNSVGVVLLVVVFFSTAGHALADNPVTRGGNTTLVWSITGATSCTGDTGGYPISTDGLFDYWNGSHTGLVSGRNYSQTFSGVTGDSTKSFPQTYTFSCSFTNPTTGAITSGSATLTVNDCGTGTTWNSTSNSCVTSCALPWGDTVASGSSVTAYQASAVTAPAVCTSETRTCTNGVLSGSGSYTNQSCTVNPAPVNGVCASAHYNCTTGTSSGTIGDTASSYNWNCGGLYGGTSTGANGILSCTEAKAATGTLTLSPISCVIASGASTCSTVYATWTTSNATTPTLVDGNVGTTLSTAANQSSPGLQVWVAYPQTVFNLKNGSTQLDTKTATASCASGTAWNANSNKCLSSTISGTISASPNPCTVAISGSTCSTNLTWSTSDNAPNPNVYSSYTGANVSTAPSGNGLSATVAHDGTTFSVRNSNSVLNSVSVTGTCALGSGWNGSICTLAPTPTLSATSPVAQNDHSTLTWGWTGETPTGCTTSVNWSNSGNLTGSGWTDPLTTGTTFTYSCTNAGGTNTATANVVVCSAGQIVSGGVCITPVCDNGANNYPTCSQCPDGKAYINGVCTACSNPSGCDGTGGTSTNPTGSLVCNNGAANPISCNTYQPTGSLTAVTQDLNIGGSTILNWSCSNITSYSGNGPIGSGSGPSVSSSGSTGPLNTPGSQPYQLTCTGANGTTPATRSVTVTVHAPSSSISANPSRVTSGGKPTITWTVNDVSSCSITRNGATPAWKPNISSSGSDSNDVVTAQTTYTLTCTDTLDNPVPPSSVTVNVLTTFQEF